MNIDDVKKVAVIGSGAMGHGIAQIFAVAGYSVFINDLQESFLQSALLKIRESLQFMVNKGKLTQNVMEEILKSNLNTTTDIGEAVRGASIVIEAVPEIMDLKKQIFKVLSDKTDPQTILVTNTSTMSISEIAGVIKNPERFAGMHFFNPVNIMKLVEIIYGENTGEAIADLLFEISVNCGKIPVKVLKDRPGFIVNRISAPNQALISAILDEGKIKPDLIDSVMKKIGVKMGPFETADFVGLDVFTHTLDYYSKTLSPEYKPGRFLLDKISRNELGMKSGKGIYDWSSGKASINSSDEASDVTPVHFLSVQINEAVKVYKEGITGSTDDIDSAVKYGMNSFAGPFAMGAGMEPSQIAGALNYLSERYNLSILKPVPEIVEGSFKKMKK